MSVSHHLTDETIHDYVTGGLTQPMEVLVACHLTVCAQCRQRVSMAEALGGHLFDAVTPEDVALSPAELIARAGMSEGSAPAVAEASAADEPNGPGEEAWIPGVPRPLGRLLPAPLEELKWRRVAPGIRQFRLNREPRKQGAFQLLHLAPGTQLIEHSHSDRELTFLVQGSYVDSIGHFRAGDIADLDGAVEHRPVVDSDIPCIALIATQSPVQYSGMIGKIMQPFVGI